MIEAVIFDMDGLLIDSEPFWQEAEIEVFSEVGIQLTHDMCTRTIGMRTNEVVEYWFHRQPWDKRQHSLEAVTEGIIDRVIDMINRQGQALPGAEDVLHFVAQKDVGIALASSSNYRLIEAVLKKLNISEYFQAIHSAQDEQYGKPHPATYLGAAAKLGISPKRCLALEDSLFGVLAAKAASMKCIAVPEPRLAGDQRFAIADLILPTLQEFSEQHWHQLNNDH